MRYDAWVLVVTILLPGCGGEPGVPRAEHEALLQRLDAMDQRVDALEEALAKGPTTASERAPAPHDPSLGRFPAIPEDAELGEPSPTLALRVTLTGLEVDGKVLTREAAEAHFREVARTAPSTRLMVVADPGVSHGAVIDALDLAREAGLTEVAMSARLHGEGGAAGEGAVTAGL